MLIDLLLLLRLFLLSFFGFMCCLVPFEDHYLIGIALSIDGISVEYSIGFEAKSRKRMFEAFLEKRNKYEIIVHIFSGQFSARDTFGMVWPGAYAEYMAS